MQITKYKHFIPFSKTSFDYESVLYANSLFIELLNFGILADNEIIYRISRLPLVEAIKTCKAISTEYIVDGLNPPLFKNWEQRTYFSAGEFIVQVLGYVFQISGNDLQDKNFSTNLKTNIDFKKFRTLSLASDHEMLDYVTNLFSSNVSQDKSSFNKLIDAALYFGDNLNYFTNIKSDEARTAAILGLYKNNSLYNCFKQLNCKPNDVLHFAAAKLDFDKVKLPHDVKYGNLSWSERIAALKFLSEFDFEELNESFGINRNAWIRYFKHIHLLSQKGFSKRFSNICMAYFVANGNRLELAPQDFVQNLKPLIAQKVIDLTPSGTLAYRTFASRLQSAIENKDIQSIEVLANKRPNHILRNITAVANGISNVDNKRFIKLIKSILVKASPSVLFSILSINVEAKWRIIDIKGNTVVEPANYNPIIGEIKNDIKTEIYNRWGYKGKVDVQSSLKNNIVPFLAKNTNLQRGTTFSVKKKDFLYFFVHWIQNQTRTDIDHSFICFDENWKSEMVWYGRQANNYIASSGDITNAPAPNGATEYAKISLNNIPKNIKYIAPIINVYTGDVFSDNKEVKAGFFTSNNTEFTLSCDHNTFVLNQPAQANIPFIFNVETQKILLLDLNLREKLSSSGHGYVETIKNAIEATNTKYYISIEKLAKMLSGNSDEVSLKITNKAEDKNEITPEQLFSLFN